MRLTLFHVKQLKPYFTSSTPPPPPLFTKTETQKIQIIYVELESSHLNQDLSFPNSKDGTRAIR